MSKELESFYRMKDTLISEGYSYNESFQDFAIVLQALKDKEMEHTLRLRLEDANNELVRQIQEQENEIVTKKLKAFDIIKECFVSEFKLFEKDGEYFILFYFDETHELTFKLKNYEEYNLLKGVLL